MCVEASQKRGFQRQKCIDQGTDASFLVFPFSSLRDRRKYFHQLTHSLSRSPPPATPPSTRRAARRGGGVFIQRGGWESCNARRGEKGGKKKTGAEMRGWQKEAKGGRGVCWGEGTEGKKRRRKRWREGGRGGARGGPGCPRVGLWLVCTGPISFVMFVC